LSTEDARSHSKKKRQQRATMSDGTANVQEAIVNARKEAAALQEQIKANREATNDAKLENFSVPEIAPGSLKIKCRQVLRGHLAKIYSLAWSSDSKQIVSASQDGKLIIWNALTTYKLHAIPLRSHWVMTCAYSPSGNFVACGGLDNICSVYNLRSSGQQSVIKVTRELSAHTGYLSCCKFMTDRHILTSSGDMSCILWDTEIGQALHKFTEHTGDVMSISVSQDQNTFISGACDSQAKIWDIRSGKCVQTFVGHESDINSVQYFPNGLSFGTGSDDASCRLFDIRADRELMTYSDDSIREGVTSISFSKSGRFLFAAYDDKKVIAWDTLKGIQLQTMAEHENRVSCLAVSPDGRALCTGSWDHTLKVWA